MDGYLHTKQIGKERTSVLSKKKIQYHLYCLYNDTYSKENINSFEYLNRQNMPQQKEKFKKLYQFI